MSVGPQIREGTVSCGCVGRTAYKRMTALLIRRLRLCGRDKGICIENEASLICDPCNTSVPVTTDLLPKVSTRSSRP